MCLLLERLQLKGGVPLADTAGRNFILRKHSTIDFVEIRTEVLVSTLALAAMSGSKLRRLSPVYVCFIEMIDGCWKNSRNFSDCNKRGGGCMMKLGINGHARHES